MGCPYTALIAAVAYPHIVQDASGTLRIDGTGHKVVVLLQRHLSAGTTAEEFVADHDDLTLAQAHALLAFYYDNKVEMDEVMRRREKAAARIRTELVPPPALGRFQALKRARDSRGD